MPPEVPVKEGECGRSRQQELRAERTANGRCPRCGRRPPEPGLKLCHGCNEKRRAAERIRRHKARAEGNQYGGRDPDRCRRADRAADRRRRRAWRDAGLCTSCGRERPAAGRSVCEPCGDDARAAARTRYAARRAARLCVRCKQPTVGGSSRCGRCAALEAERASPARRSAVRKKRYVRRRARRLCVDCSAPVGATARCEGCARRSNSRAPEPHRAPLPFPEYTVVELESGDEIGSFETEAEAAACLVFAGLRRDQVEVRANVPLLAICAQ